MRSESAAQFLTVALERKDPDRVLRVLREIACARGMSKVAEQAGLRRESLYRSLSPGASPRFETILSIVLALGIELSAQPTMGRTPFRR
jgi:probable addiction module antidote protein